MRTTFWHSWLKVSGIALLALLSTLPATGQSSLAVSESTAESLDEASNSRFSAAQTSCREATLAAGINEMRQYLYDLREQIIYTSQLLVRQDALLEAQRAQLLQLQEQQTTIVRQQQEILTSLEAVSKAVLPETNAQASSDLD